MSSQKSSIPKRKKVTVWRVSEIGPKWILQTVMVTHADGRGCPKNRARTAMAIGPLFPSCRKYFHRTKSYEVQRQWAYTQSYSDRWIAGVSSPGHTGQLYWPKVGAHRHLPVAPPIISEVDAVALSPTFSIPLVCSVVFTVWDLLVSKQNGTPSTIGVPTENEATIIWTC